MFEAGLYGYRWANHFLVESNLLVARKISSRAVLDDPVGLVLRRLGAAQRLVLREPPEPVLRTLLIQIAANFSCTLERRMRILVSLTEHNPRSWI